MLLDNKVAVITGGAGRNGLGFATARQMAAHGARVVILDLAAASPGQAAAQLGAGHLGFVADVTDRQACEAAAAQVLEAHGRIDILVNNAGVNDGVGLEAGVEAFIGSLKKNLIHVYALAHYALDSLKATKGVIINIGSKVCETGQGGTSGYAASKGGINALTREWAVDLAPFGIRVNAVLPAETWTPLYEKCLAAMPDPKAARAEMEQLIPLGRRFTTIEELANMAVFLASPCSSHTTGQIIFVDGGYTHLDRKCTVKSDVASFGAAAK